MKIRELTTDHVGLVLTVETPDGVTITGPLRDVSTETDWVEDRQANQRDPEWVAGRVTTNVSIGRWNTTDLDPNTTATIEKSL